MKVVIRKSQKTRRRKPRRQAYKTYAIALEKVELGHIYPINKYYFLQHSSTPIKQYLRRAYGGEFVLTFESKNKYIVKRVKDHASYPDSEKTEIRQGRFYLPKRKSSNC
jgi:hypothetical protein